MAAALTPVYGLETPHTITKLNHRQVATETSSLSTPTTMITFTTTELIVIDGETNAVLTIPAKTITLALPTCIQTVMPDSNGHVPPGTCGAIWDYYPSYGAAIAFTILFAALVAAHIWMAIKYQKVRVNAFAYMTFGRMIYYFHPSRAIFRMPAATISAIFVFFDLTAFVVQLIGGSMAGPSASPEAQERGLNLYMGGIGFQQFMILVFVGLCVAFQLQMTRFKTVHGNSSILHDRRYWMPLLSALYIALAMITVRIIYRLVEFSGGIEKGSVLTTREVYFYLLEAVPMLCALTCFAVCHPGRFMNGPGSDMPGIFSLLRNKLFPRSSRKGVLRDGGYNSDRHELAPRTDVY
ncbi:hypothetical protein LTR84_009957 [Exophiala bonariae]|uniref:RTA1 domain protein n=1 Tax=Exophiala bonariae TaxID=1690606 RepID=A0AAV9NM86_9EURO|nr:hypothetical protein LTR84_009957 [Exophiala bonariae]